VSTLTADDVERVAQRAAELMRDELAALLGTSRNDVATGLVDVATVATTLSVSQKFVRAHARQLGGRQIVGRWRFDLSVALAADTQSHAPPPEIRRPRRTRPVPRSGVPLMAIRGDGLDGR
jgi:hypothetical protein